MNPLREAAQQALEALDRYSGVAQRACDAEEALRITLKQEVEAAAWLAERKDHWRKEREKAQAAKDQDPELSAALGWPGGISNPVLDRTQLLRMVAALRVSAQQALEAKSLAGILLREHDNVEQAINYAERMAQRYAESRSLMAMEYQDAAKELKAWKQNRRL